MNHLNDAPKSAPDTKKLLAELDVLAEAGALSADHIQMLALIAQQAAARQTGSPAHVDAPAAAGVVERVQAVAATVSPAPHVAPAPVSAVVEETPEARADRVIASVLSMLGARKGGLYIAGQRPGQGGHSSFFAMNDLAGLNMQDEKSVNTFGKSIVRSSYNRIFDVTQEDLLNTKPYAYMETFVDQYPDPIIVSWAPIDSEVMIALTTGDERFDNRS